MGNLCSKNTNKLLNSNTISTTNSSSSLDKMYDFELRYAPQSGEGESIKVLFAFLSLPYREKIENNPAAVTTLKCKEVEIRGTLACMRYLCKKFKLYPSDSCTSEDICSQILALWHLGRDDFYNNNRANVHKFYTEKLPQFFRKIEQHIKHGSQGILENRVTMCDILTVTFVYNLFYRNSYPEVLSQNAPKLMAFCQRFVENHLQVYFTSRQFSLYI